MNQIGVPNIIVLASVILSLNLIGLILFLVKDKRKRRRLMWTILLLEYMFVIFSSTVLFRTHYNESRVILTPLASLHRLAAHTSSPHEWFQVLGNLFMLTPMGFILRFLIRNGGYWKSTLIGLLFSASIEYSQHTLNVGTAEVDDLLFNTLGCLIGYALARLLFRHKKKHPAH